LFFGFRVVPAPPNLLASEASNFEEASMGLRFQAALCTLALIGVFASASAQEVRRVRTGSTSTETPRPTLTGKERLGQKWTDEQRIDNCHVPVDKRGIKPRPSACPNDPSS
jgi:hypothetical protein